MSVITKEIGRVSIIPKGVWNGQNTYTRLDLVSYNGSSYIAKQDVPVNTSLNNSDYWKLVAEKGDIGISISGVRKTDTNVLTDTYTIDFTDGTNTTFEVENGNGILNITKTGTNGIVDTYTITFTNGTSTTFNVTNGSDIASITKTGTSADGLVDTYTVTLTNDETHTFVVRNGNGIASITKTGTSANRLTDTYTITFEDGTSTTFNVNHGVGILSITGPVSVGLTDTYTINFTDGTNTTFDVQNARSISSITKVDVTGAAGHTDTYDINFNDNSTPFRLEIYNGQNGEGSASTVDEVQADGEGNVPLLIFGNAPPTASTVGQLKQRYYDRTNEILYICTGIDTSGAQAVYTWQGTGVPVDNQLDENSENPVQNKVLTEIIGKTSLTSSLQDLTSGLNITYSLTQDKLYERNVALQHSISKTYNTGDYVIYARDLYRCIDDNVTGIWNASKWQKITITSELDTKAPVGLGITNASVGKVPVIKTVDANGIPTSYEFGDKGTPIDSALSTTSENPVQNKVIKDALDHKATSDYFALQDTQPTNPETMLWVNEHSNDNDEIEVYTVDEVYNKDEVDEMVLPTGGASDAVLVKNSGTDYDVKWTNTPPQMGSLATIEPTSTVTQKQLYNQGDYLVYNGQLYIVTDDTISQGVTLNPGQGGNIEAVQDGGFNALVSRLTPALYMQSIDVGSGKAILITPPDGKRHEYLIFSAWNDRLVLGLASIYIDGNAVHWNGLPLLQGSTMTASIENGKLKLTTGQQLWAHVGVISTSKFTLESSAT